MEEIAGRIKDIIKKSREELERGESAKKIASKVSSSLFDLGKETGNKELIIISFLWSDINVPLNIIIEREMRKTFPKILEEETKGKDHELARRFLSFLSRRNFEAIAYRHLIDYETGEVNFEEVDTTFKIKDFELSMEEKGFITLTIAKGLEEAWKKSYTEANKFILFYIDKLSDSFRSIKENDKEILNELKKVTEDILYEAHLKAWVGDCDEYGGINYYFKLL